MKREALSTRPPWAVFSLFFVFFVIMAAGRADAAVYACGNPGSGHCYGYTSWSEQPEYFGAYTDITQVAMACPGNCGGFIDDEIWLVDASSAACRANSFHRCWVEAGYIHRAGHAKQYFWADARPVAAHPFTLHLLGRTDPNGTINHYMIIKDARGEGGVFQVWIYNTALTTLYHGTSSPNTMTGKQIIIGQELAGTKNASAGTARLERNIWAVRPLGADYTFWYRPQTTDSPVTSQNPPSASWAVRPSHPPPEGGRLNTHCCS